MMWKQKGDRCRAHWWCSPILGHHISIRCSMAYSCVLWLKSRNNTNAERGKRHKIKDHNLISCWGECKNIRNIRCWSLIVLYISSHIIML